MKYDDAIEKAKAMIAEAKAEAVPFAAVSKDPELSAKMERSFMEAILKVRIAKMILEAENDGYKGMWVNNKGLIDKGKKFDRLVELFRDSAHRFDVHEWMKIKNLIDGKD